MPRPEPNRDWDQKSPDVAKGPAPVESSNELLEIARTLAVHGGWSGSSDLALDLVLNEVVEQARLSTGATGAAIALARDGEMVCRASAGDAPGLGERLEMNSGLSGASLQSGSVQICGDTETDSRVNAAATRRMGVRSILVVPLAAADEMFGIIEVFSSRQNAFGERDVSTLQALARRVVDNKKKAEQVAAQVVPIAAEPPKAELPKEDAPKETTSEAAVPETQTGAAAAEATADEPFESEGNVIGEETTKRFELWTTVLAVLVIVVAVLLGLAIGWRAGIGGQFRAAAPVRTIATARATANGEASSGAQQPTSLPTSSDSAQPTAAQPTTAQPKAGGASAQRKSALEVTTDSGQGDDAPTGGLLVTENGKVIYRLSPGDEQGAPPVRGSSGSQRSSSNRLIHRVEPEYPAEAKADQIQGAVTLEVQIGQDGAVSNITVIDGAPILAQAAVQAVRQWRYQPYSVNGRPVEMQTRVTIRFTLPPA